MNILKLTLLGSLRIASFGFLKVALCAYTLFLSDTAFAGTAREGNGQASLATLFPTAHPKVTATPIWLGGTQCFRRPAPDHDRFKVNRSWSLSVCLLA
jgi:hypothetical protein